jgi:BirA family biotin operon repressor/biotin-[acetyl-CoA-carboxylase] ligase
VNSRIALDIERLTLGLAACPLVTAFHYAPIIDSTNRVLRDRLPTGEAGLLVVTDEQTRGRGRRDNRWLAPACSSVLLSVALKSAGLYQTDIVIAAALAVAEAVETTCGLRPDIKWPNDVLAPGGKVCGILAEQLPGGCVALGVGINCNFDPAVEPGFPAGASSLSSELGRAVDREKLVTILFKRLHVWYRCLTLSRETVFKEWSDRLVTVGRPVEVVTEGQPWPATAVGVRRDGALLVVDSLGTTHTLYAADVSVRPGRPVLD